MKRTLIAIACVLAPSQGWAAEVPYLDGTFYLDMAQSRWGGGVNGAPGGPESAGSHLVTGGRWVFDKDDGSRRQGSLIQTRRDGSFQVFHYDVAYDGRMYWLNDWYQESTRRIDDRTFEVSWAVVRDGKKVHAGGPVTCRINAPRDSFACDDAGLHEVYSKGARPPAMPGPVD